MPAAGQSRRGPGDHAGLDGVAHLDVEEVLLGHDPHGGGAGGEVAPEIARWRAAPGARAPGGAGRSGRRRRARWRCGCGQSTSPGITKRSLQIERRRAPAGPAWSRRAPTAAMRPSSTTTTASRTGAAPVPSKSVPQRISRVDAMHTSPPTVVLVRSVREATGRPRSMSVPAIASSLGGGLEVGTRPPSDLSSAARSIGPSQKPGNTGGRGGASVR